MKAGIFAHVRGKLGRGLLIVLPMLITVWLLKFLFDIINRNVTPFVLTVLQALELPGLHLWPVRVLVPVIGIILTAGSIYLIGLLAGNIAGSSSSGRMRR